MAKSKTIPAVTAPKPKDTIFSIRLSEADYYELVRLAGEAIAAPQRWPS